MKSSQLASLMLDWENAQTKADSLAQQIREEILKLGKSQTVGNVVATYRKGTTSYDYETPARATIQPDILADKYSKLVYNFREACIDNNIEPLVIGIGDPSVSLKLKVTDDNSD